MASNTVEIVVKILDQVSSNIEKMQSRLSRFASSTAGQFATFAGIGLSVNALVKNVIEADKSLRRFDFAMRTFGQGVGVPRERLEQFATSMQRTTRFSDDAVREMQTTLLRFASITGSTFLATQQVVADVAEGMGTDLASAAMTAGRALESPALSMRLLRQMGIYLNDEQQKLINNFEDTGRHGAAQQIILDAMKAKFKGAADEGVKSLSGALENLGNNFMDALEGTPEKVSAITTAMNDLSKAVQDPKFREALNQIFGIFISVGKMVGPVLEAAAKGWSNIGSALDRAAPTWKEFFNGGDITKLQGRIEDTQAEFDRVSKSAMGMKDKTGESYRALVRQAESYADKLKSLRGELDQKLELSVSLRGDTLTQVQKPEDKVVTKPDSGKPSDDALASAKKAADAWAKHLQEMQDNTRTAMEKIETEFATKQSDISELLSKHIIDPADAGARAEEAAIAYIDSLRSTFAKGDMGFDAMYVAFQREQNRIEELAAKGLIDPDTAAVLGERAGKAYGEALHDAIEAKLGVTKETIEAALDVTGAVDSGLAEIVKQSGAVTDAALSDAKLKLGQMQAGVDKFVDTLTAGLQNAAREGKLSMKDMVRFIISQLLSDALSNAIKSLGDALKDALGGALSGGGGGGFLSGLMSGIGSLFGLAGGGFAAGGMAYASAGGPALGTDEFAAGGMAAAAGGMTMVGEEGPELVKLPRGSRVYSNSQSKGMMGGSVNFAPVSNIAIVANDKDAQTLRAEFYTMLQSSERRQQKQLFETLNRNGFGRMR